ncbi:uncharacterized protein L3040_009255 [Drepanopeziza brunnea f. sp. 'multigermtubi']|uniref:Uncharacterized protein n=1 Tax=Marssonina brunnea f. sp. multigermtubi (strain MB_m1) TaxID=1072389 RepID=K1Y2C3_MARBU|nr:uncharacterized protein MBM_02541 [Drepanopeziza brunnea f. sp. 'multigermtubi' MB_m1]EKD19304.1 hypothetical protein MBM_02541 [Drepanopeziza brunnea f. sp. 'multigermtubi' MB_m1]KAJ5032659.1 hypothetical protein L3040_009255 [Drepanopeziza brunnea f. sp. 'multigermtubi']
MSDSTKTTPTEPKDDSSNTASSTSSTSILGGLLSGSSLKTPGVKNIEAAYSRAGATNHHTPGVASKLGSQAQESGAGNGEHQGVGSQKFQDGISDQRQEPSTIGKVFNNMINGTDRTK